MHVLTLVYVFLQVYMLDCFLYHDIKRYEFSRNEKHYGISVLLQNGTPPVLVVGSPHDKETGSVHIHRLQNVETDEVLTPQVLDPNIPKTYLYGLSMDGGVNSGEPFMVGLPRYIIRQSVSNTENYFCNGAAYYFRNISDTNNPFPLYPNEKSNAQIREQKYYLGFGEAGFSVRYMDNYKEFLLGSPGILGWAGGAIRIYESQVMVPPQSRRSINRNRRDSVYSYNLIRQLQESLDDYDYGGYSVTIGKFAVGKLFYVIGAPRAYELKGAVFILERDDRVKLKVLQSAPNIGTYFGASVCVLDTNGDGYDDLLVGAPTQNDREFNEGYVYAYINDQNGDLILKQSFSQKISMGQFGTSMTNLGKITLDAYDSVAISSPYEKEGRGAIYIYTGSDAGLVLSQRIEIEASKPSLAFGYSLSRAVDIDGNTGTDFAVGAYQSKNVYVLLARTPFYFNFSIETVSHLYSHIKNKPFNLKYCVHLSNTNSVKANITFIPDRRLKNLQSFLRSQQIEKVFCQDIQLSLNELVEDTIKPLKLEIQANEDECRDCPVSSPNYSRNKIYEIPFLFDCGDDQICTPNLEVTSSLHNSKFLVGSSNAIKLKLDITNNEEYAYICKLGIKLPPSVTMKSLPKSCSRGICPLKNPLSKSDGLEFELDMQQIKSVVPNITIEVNINCVNYTKISLSTLFLAYKSDIHFDGYQDKVIYDPTNTSQLAKSKHEYYFKNNGPSLLENFKFSVKIPRILLFSGETAVFKIYDPNNKVNNLVCDSDTKYNDDSEDSESSIDSIQAAGFLGSDRKATVLSCSDTNIKCMEIKCTVQKFVKNEEFKLTFPFKADISQIVKYYDSTFTVHSQVSYVLESKIYTSETNIVFEENTGGTYYSILAIVLGVTFGLLLLVGIIYGLYKINFFRRVKYEKMQQEKNGKSTEELTELSHAR